MGSVMDGGAKKKRKGTPANPNIHPGHISGAGDLKSRWYDGHTFRAMAGRRVSLSPGEITQILLDLRGGDRDAQERLIPLVYSELRRIAGIHLYRETVNHSLQPTALVHEAYLRLIEINRVDWQCRTHFFSISSRVMRRILVDHARTRQADKRGGGVDPVLYDEGLLVPQGRSPDLLALDTALDQLAAFDQRKAQIVEMRFFAGMTEEETGCALGISARTVKRDWRLAKAWLYKELSYEVVR